MAKPKFDKSKFLQKEKQKEVKHDPNMIPYWEMSENDELILRIIPDDSGHAFSNGLWLEFDTHFLEKPYLCPKSLGSRKCACCKSGWDKWHEAGGKKASPEDSLMKMSKRLRASTTRLMNVYVVETTLDLPEGDKGKKIKLFRPPVAVCTTIKKAFDQGIVTDHISDHDLVIKVTNDGGKRSYEMSFVKAKADPLPDKFWDKLDEIGGPFNLVEMIPEEHPDLAELARLIEAEYDQGSSRGFDKGEQSFEKPVSKAESVVSDSATLDDDDDLEDFEF